MKNISLIIILALIIGCSHLIHYENDNVLEFTGKTLVRLPLCLATVGLSEVYMGGVTKRHNRNLIEQKWERCYATDNQYEREKLLREIEHLYNLNASVDADIRNMYNSLGNASRSRSKKRINCWCSQWNIAPRGRPPQYLTNCHCD